MKQAIFLLFILIFFIGCTGPSVPISTSDTTSDGFSYRGMGGLPDGFDAQGHRGARGLVPENTLPSFEAALDLGVTTLELDLHYTQDGHVVVWHDPVISDEKCRLPDGYSGDAPDPKTSITASFC